MGQTVEKSKFYGFPIAKVGVLYLAIQLIGGLVFMALGQQAEQVLAERNQLCKLSKAK